MKDYVGEGKFGPDGLVFYHLEALMPYKFGHLSCYVWHETHIDIHRFNI